MNIINFVKERIFRKKGADTSIRKVDELFKNGHILKATSKELESAIVEIANQVDQSPTIQSRNIIRCLIINNIQGQRYTDKIDGRNTILTIIIIVLTIVNVYLAIQQTNYVELSSRSDRILQMEAIQRAVTLCKQSPDLQDSGLRNTLDGSIASCPEILKQYK